MNIFDIFKKKKIDAPLFAEKENLGRNATRLNIGQIHLFAKINKSDESDDGIWYSDMTPEQKEQYGFFKMPNGLPKYKGRK